MVVLSTTAQLLFTAVNESFLIEADPANTVNARLSSTDPSVSLSFVSLAGGQQQIYENWTGPVYAVSASSTCLVYVEMITRGTQGTSAKAP